MVDRANALVANLTMAEKLNTFMLTGQLHGIGRLNVKSFRWDATDIEGVDDQVFHFNNTCFPHAVGIGATWDRELIAEISQITAIEARVLEEKYWVEHHGTYIGATNFDGGPLANVAYDPRVGRISEMYGECPYHTGQVGITATRELQNKTGVAPNGDYFLQVCPVHPARLKLWLRKISHAKVLSVLRQHRLAEADDRHLC
jgi:beta-glucosidase